MTGMFQSTIASDTPGAVFKRSIASPPCPASSTSNPSSIRTRPMMILMARESSTTKACMCDSPGGARSGGHSVAEAAAGAVSFVRSVRRARGGQRVIIQTEAPHHRLRLGGQLRQRGRGGQRGAGARGRALRGRGQAAEGACEGGGAARRRRDVASDLVGLRRLLLDRAGDGGGDVVDLVDDAADLLDGLDGGGRVALDGVDLQADVLGGLGGLLGQLLHLVGDPHKALAGLAGLFFF